MIKEIHVFDFDGTLVDSSHRYRLNPETGRIDLQYWIDNEHRALEDSIIPEMVAHFRELNRNPEVFCMIATARIWCELSEQFAAQHDLQCHVVARRGRDDSRGGVKLKVTGINRLLNLKQFRNVEEIHVYEDNLDYLNGICNTYDIAIPHFIASNQGY